MSIPDNQVAFPYFAMIFSELRKDSSAFARAYRDHVHWGYWEKPELATLSGDEYHQAAQRLTDKILLQSGIRSGHSILDVGCGFGGTVRTINRTFSQVRITGLNIDQEQIDRARALTTAENYNQIEFVNADACQLPFADNQFDVVLAVECMHHFSSRHEFYKEVARVLKPGGRLVVSDYIYRSVTMPIFKIINRMLKIPFQAMWGYSIIASDRWYRQMASEIGFYKGFDEDITKNTAPSLRFVREHGRNMRRPTVSNIFGTWGYDLITKTGMVRYKILTFGIK